MSSEIERFYFIDYGEEPFIRELDHQRIVKELEAQRRCDYRLDDCVNDGEMIDGRWVCRNHLKRLGQVSDRLSGGDARQANLEHGGGKSMRPLDAPYGPSLSDAIKEVEAMRDGWMNRSTGEHACAANDIIKKLKSLGPQKQA